MNQSKLIYLSYIVDNNTPTYGNRSVFDIDKKSSIAKGDVANDSFINTTVHIGTHIDMPYHFFDDGQTIEDFDVDYFRFNNVLYIDLVPKEIIIKNDLIDILEEKNDKEKYDLLIVKTGICNNRDKDVFWKENYGFDPRIADYLKEKFPNIRVFGFDSISVSSFANRKLGREAHKAFLNHTKPILLLEDMDLRYINEQSIINEVIMAPIRIKKCDGLPCTVIAKIEK
jgi:kynurenine formamidase